METCTTAFCCLDDGNIVPVPSFRRSDLQPEKVFLFLDERAFRLFLWVGQNAKPRTKFLAANGAQTLRAEHGFSIRTVREEGGEESDGFIQMLDTLNMLPPREIQPEPVAPQPASQELPTKPVESIVREERTTPEETREAYAVDMDSRILISPPRCHECNKGYFLPYSTKSSVKRSQVLPLGRWTCSFCGAEAKRLSREE